MSTNNLTPQERISFLEQFISEINRQLDEITERRDYPREIKAMQLRVDVLKQGGEKKFAEQLAKIQNQLSELEKSWAKKEPIIRILEEERALYRQILNEI